MWKQGDCYMQVVWKQSDYVCKEAMKIWKGKKTRCNEQLIRVWESYANMLRREFNHLTDVKCRSPVEYKSWSWKRRLHELNWILRHHMDWMLSYTRFPNWNSLPLKSELNQTISSLILIPFFSFAAYKNGLQRTEEIS